MREEEKREKVREKNVEERIRIQREEKQEE